MNELENKILHKAAELFANLGVKVVTMDDVASSLGVSKKTIYTHFSTKKSLVEQCFNWLLEEIEKIIEEAIKEDINSLRKIIIIHLKIEDLFDTKDSCMMQLSKYYPKVFEKVMTRQLEIIDKSIVKNFYEGVKSSYFIKELDAQLMARFFYTIIFSVENTNVFNLGHSHKELKLESVLYHLRSISTEKGRIELIKLQKEYKL